MSTTVFLDCETGGLLPEHPIIQIGAVAVSDWQESETFERKLQFDPAACDPEALRLNSYDAATWEQSARPEADVIRAFKAFLERHRTAQMISKRSGRPYTVARVGGHNIVGFDLDLLTRAFKRQGEFFPIKFSDVLDTLHGCSWYFERRAERPADFKLMTVARFFGLDVSGVHDALTDARLAMQIARNLLEEGY